MRNILLIQHRITKGLTQAEMAEQLFMSQSTYSRIETGEKQPSIDTLKQIAHILQVPVRDLLDVFIDGNTSVLHKRITQKKADTEMYQETIDRQANQIKLLSELNNQLVERLSLLEAQRSTTDQNLIAH